MQSKACLGYAEVQPAFDGTSKLELGSDLHSACRLFYAKIIIRFELCKMNNFGFVVKKPSLKGTYPETEDGKPIR